MRDFQKIIAWQKAHALDVLIQDAVDWKRFRVRPGLRSQLLRSVGSVPANIAEGAGRPTQPDFVRYLHTALSSAREAQNHLLLARGIKCIEPAVARRLLDDIDEVQRVLYGYIRAITGKAPEVGEGPKPALTNEEPLDDEEPGDVPDAKPLDDGEPGDVPDDEEDW